MEDCDELKQQIGYLMKVLTYLNTPWSVLLQRVHEIFRASLESRRPAARAVHVNKSEQDEVDMSHESPAHELKPQKHRSTASIVIDKPVRVSTTVTRRAERKPDTAKSAHVQYHQSSSSSGGTTPTVEAFSAPNVYLSPAKRVRQKIARDGSRDVSSAVEGAQAGSDAVMRSEYCVDGSSESSSNERFTDHETTAAMRVTDGSVSSTPSSCVLQRDAPAHGDVINISPPNVHAHGANTMFSTFQLTRQLVG